MSNINAVITGVGGYVPDYVLTNDELSRMVDTSDEWIMTRVGIRERRILKGEGMGTSFMAHKAVEQLIQRTDIDPQTIDCLIVATTTPDYKFPSTASLVLGRLGLKNAFAFDMSCACCGFLYALDMGCSMITSGRYKRVVVVGADKNSSMVNYQDRQTCVLFGDGAGCVLLEATNKSGVGMQNSILRTDGEGYPYLHMEAGGSAQPLTKKTLGTPAQYIYQEGPTVFRYAVTAMADDVLEILKRNELSYEDVDWIFPHEANYRIIEAVAKRAQIPLEKCVVNIDHFGNTSAASIPLALWEKERDLRKGQNLIFTAFGAGFVHGASFDKWAYDGSKR